MNRRISARRSSLFLIELMLAILFFAVACGVCVQFLVKARLMSREAAQLTEAVECCTMASETIASGDSLGDISVRLGEVYPGCEADLTGLGDDSDEADVVGGNIEASEADEADETGDVQIFQLTEELSATCSLTNGMLHVLLSYTTDSEEEPVYTLTVEKYLGGDANA